MSFSGKESGLAVYDKEAYLDTLLSNVYYQHDSLSKRLKSISNSLNVLVNTSNINISTKISKITLNISQMLNVAYLKINDKISELTKDLVTKYTYLSENNPKSILNKGYAVVSKDAKRLYSIKQIKQGDHIKLTMADGHIEINA